MQTTSFENHTPVMSMQLKTENQYLPVGVTARNAEPFWPPFRNGSPHYLGVRKTTSRSWWPNSGRNKTGAVSASINKICIAT